MRSVFVYTLFILLVMSTTAKAQDTLATINSLWNYSDPAASEQNFLEAKAKGEAQNDSSYVGQIITQIARTYSLRGEFDTARQVLEEVANWDFEKYPLVEIRYYLELGRTYNSSGDKENAQKYFQQAWHVAVKQQQDYLSVDAAHMMALAVPELDDQINWTNNGIYIAEHTEDKETKGWLGPLYNNLAWNYFDNKMYDEALEFFQKGLDFRITNNGNARGIFIAKWSVGRAYRALGKNKKALEIQQELEQEIVSKGLDPDGFVYEELAELYWDMNKKDLAKSYYGLAYDLLSKENWLVKSEPDRIQRLKERGGR